MPHWKNLGAYDYLGAYSFDSCPFKEIVLTISRVEGGVVTSEGGKTEKRPIAHFREENTNVLGIQVKPMVLNPTNSKILERLFKSGLTEDWIGKKIIIYPSTTRFGKDPNVPCLRIKEEIPTITCCECGKEIELKIYLASRAKYGFAVCSAECLKKHNGEKIEENKEEVENA